MSSITIVTGLWNINRDGLSEGWSRSYKHYLDNFSKLLELPNNMIIFGESDLEEFVFSKRNHDNTQFIVRSTDWFKGHFFDEIQKIRTSEDWLSQAGWLRESTQARLEMYNPLVMSKPFLLNDARVFDKFNSSHLFWLDAGITNTVHPGYFTHDKVLEKLDNINKLSFIAFPYDAEGEIHGFEYKKLCELAGGKKVNKVLRGGFFGGPKEEIPNFNTLYYDLMGTTLKSGYMGTEESLFSILAYRHPDMIQYFEIEPNGLVYKFFEDLKDGTLKAKSELGDVVPRSYNVSNLNMSKKITWVFVVEDSGSLNTQMKTILTFIFSLKMTCFSIHIKGRFVKMDTTDSLTTCMIHLFLFVEKIIMTLSNYLSQNFMGIIKHNGLGTMFHNLFENKTGLKSQNYLYKV